MREQSNSLVTLDCSQLLSTYTEQFQSALIIIPVPTYDFHPSLQDKQGTLTLHCSTPSNANLLSPKCNSYLQDTTCIRYVTQPFISHFFFKRTSPNTLCTHHFNRELQFCSAKNKSDNCQILKTHNYINFLIRS
jgi:hypothetical protein